MGLSPMMMQYQQTKENYKDSILLYRLGDFYEMFFEDAELCARELELTLTGRDCGLETRAPMCGIPHHAAETYIARLLEKGYKVGVGNLYSSHFPRYESRIRKLGMVGGQISTWTPTCEEKIQKEGKFFDIMMTSQMLWSADYKKEFTLTYDRMISSLMKLEVI